jgi:hypothetical protein
MSVAIEGQMPEVEEEDEEPQHVRQRRRGDVSGEWLVVAFAVGILFGAGLACVVMYAFVVWSTTGNPVP